MSEESGGEGPKIKGILNLDWQRDTQNVKSERGSSREHQDTRMPDVASRLIDNHHQSSWQAASIAINHHLDTLIWIAPTAIKSNWTYYTRVDESIFFHRAFRLWNQSIGIYWKIVFSILNFRKRHHSIAPTAHRRRPLCGGQVSSIRWTRWSSSFISSRSTWTSHPTPTDRSSTTGTLGDPEFLQPFRNHLSCW